MVVDQCTGIAEVMVLNPIVALDFFCHAKKQLLQLLTL